MLFPDCAAIVAAETQLVSYVAGMGGVVIVGTAALAISADMHTTVGMVVDLERRGVLRRHCDWNCSLLDITSVDPTTLRDRAIGLDATAHGRRMIATPQHAPRRGPWRVARRARRRVRRAA